MASLTNTKIKDTYPGLLKTTDNAALGGTYKLITDGLGNSSGVYLGTGGNVGIGVVPSNWSLNTLSALQIENAGLYGFSGNEVGVTANAYYNGGWKYISSTSASRYFQDINSNHIWETAASGTAGNAITFEERMRIDSSGRVGIGTSSPEDMLHIATNGTAALKFDGNGTGSARIHSTFGILNLEADDANENAASYITFKNHGSEKMRIDSSGRVGIGRTATSHILEINGEMKIVGLGASEGIDAYNDASRQWGIKSTSAGTDSGMKFEVQDSERMRIDSSGVVQVRNVDSPTLQLFNTDTSLTANQVIGDIDFYQSDPSGDGVGVVSKIRSINSSSFQGEAGLAFHTGTTSGLAERMRIDSSGNVQIGAGTRFGKFDILNVGGSGTNFIIGAGSNGDNYFTSGNSGIQVFRSGSTERMRIDSSGNVGIGGIADSDYRIHLYKATNSEMAFESTGTGGGFFRIGTGHDASGFGGALRIYDMNAAAERMRITSGGEVQIGTAGTTSGAPTYKGKIRMAKASEFESNIEFISTDFSSGYGWSIGSHDQSGGVIDLNFYSRANSATFTKRFLIEVNGNVKSSTGSYGTISSDERLKENILNASPKLEDILSLNVKNYNYIGEDSKQIGFIAQEFEQVFPSLVTERDTREYDEEGNVISGYEDTKGLKVGMEFAIIVKAIQEQQDLINELKTRIETLKSQINS